MKRDRKGQVLIFDALIFLAASSLVSVSMVGALSGDSYRDFDDQDFVDRAHSVFLRATLNLPSNQGSRDNRSMTAGQAILVLLSDQEGGEEFRARAEKEMVRILSGLLAPRFDFRWTAKGDNSSVVIEYGTGLETLRSQDTFVSSIDAFKAGIAGFVLELRAWYSSE